MEPRPPNEPDPPGPPEDDADDAPRWDKALRAAFGSAEPDLDAVPASGIARYERGEEIARGGIGVVVHAHDQNLGRAVALKFLHQRHASQEEMRQRFEREARIGGRLQHPGIVPVYEMGRAEDGTPFFAMKLVQGRTLEELLADRASPRQDLPRFLPIFEQVCQTLAYAHSHGVLHRDLKPANVMVGRFGEVQVVDWGLAKQLGEEEPAASTTQNSPPDEAASGRPDRNPDGGPDEEAHRPAARGEAMGSGSTVALSTAGSVFGTLSHMAPEQAQGRVDELGPTADVFSLGAILCEILTGRPPYVGDAASLLAQASQARLEDAHARLDDPALDAELVDLTRRCLAPDPADRPADGEQLAAELAAHRERVEERRRKAELDAHEARAVASHERRSRRLTLLLASVVLLFGGGGAALIQHQREQRRDREREAERTVAPVLSEARALEARAEEKDTTREWEQAEAGALRAVELAEAGEAPEDLRSRARDQLQRVQPRLAAARARETRQRTEQAMIDRLEAIQARWGVDPWPECAAAYQQAFRDFGLDLDTLSDEQFLARVRRTSIAIELAEGMFCWIRAQFFAGEFGGSLADTDLERRVALLQAADPDPWRCEIRGAVLGGRGEALLDMAARDEVHSVDERNLTFLAVLLHDMGEVDRGIEVLQEQLPRFPSSDLHRYLGVFLGERERWEEALLPLHVARGLDPGDSVAWTQIGAALRRLGRLREARISLEHALALEERHPQALLELGGVLERTGELEAAWTAYQEALAIEPGNASVLVGLARVEGRQGEIEEACRLLGEACELGLRRLEWSPPPLHAPIYHRELQPIAPMLQLWGRSDQAEAFLHEGVRIARGAVPLELGVLLVEQGRFEEGLEQLRRHHQGQPGALALAWIYEARRMVLLADELEDLALDETLQDADELAARARALTRRGQTRGASQHWRRALALDPAVAGAPGVSAGYDAARAAILGGTPQDRGLALRWLEAELERACDAAGRALPARRDELVRWQMDPRLQACFGPGSSEGWIALSERLRRALSDEG